MKQFFFLLAIAAMMVILLLPSHAQMKLPDDYTKGEMNFIKEYEKILDDTLNFDRERFIAYYEKMHNTKPPEFIIKQVQREWVIGLLQDAAQYSYLTGMRLLMRSEYEKAIKFFKRARLLDPLNIRYSFGLTEAQEKMNSKK